MKVKSLLGAIAHAAASVSIAPSRRYAQRLGATEIFVNLGSPTKDYVHAERRLLRLGHRPLSSFFDRVAPATALSFSATLA